MIVNKIVTVDAAVPGCVIVVVNARAPIVVPAKGLAIAIAAVAFNADARERTAVFSPLSSHGGR